MQGVIRLTVINDIESLNTPVVDVLLTECSLDVTDWTSKVYFPAISQTYPKKAWFFHVKSNKNELFQSQNPTLGTSY